MFFKKSTPTWLVAGLGNPGKKYEAARHNAGFLCLDLLAMREKSRITRLKFHALTGEAQIRGERCLLMKPQTFMNDSGRAIKAAAAFYKIPPERILILVDEISLPPSRLRIRRKGSAGSHNGIRSIIQHMDTQEFPRIKLGVGERPNPQWDLADWVLSNMTDKEQKLLRVACDDALDAIDLIVDGEINTAMGRFSS